MGTSPPPFTIQLLGNVRFVDGPDGSLRLEGHRIQAFLAYLVLHSQAPQSRQRLAFLFWPDTPESQARTNLRNLLHRLRRLLPQADTFLRIDTTHIQWRPDAPFTCDALDFQVALREAQRHQEAGRPHAAEDGLRRAVSLYRGDLMPGCYEEWLLPTRERFRQDALHALETLVRLQESRWAYGDAVASCQTWLRLDPLNETAYRTLMRLYALQDNRAAALQTYHACVSILQQELSVEPGPATQELYHRLVHGRPVQPHGQVPRTTQAPLIGRDEPWQALLHLWRTVRLGQAPSQCVLITGEAGIGKSRLVEEFTAWVQRQGFVAAMARGHLSRDRLAYEPVTTWFQRLPLTTLHDAWRVEIARLLPQVLDGYPHLGPPGPLQEAWQRRRFFQVLTQVVLAHHQPILLVLEDAHWADDETLDWLAYLLRHARDDRLILVLTARDEDLVPAHPLHPLVADWRRTGRLTHLPLSRLDPTQTHRLAVHLVGHDLSPEVGAALYRHTEGNPLFIVEYVNAGLEALDEGSALPARPRNLLLAHYRQLSSHARTLAQAAAAIGPTFTTDLLAQVVELPDHLLLHALDELWQRRIVREEGPAAYRFFHHKLWQTIYEEMGPVQRQTLHARVARALDRHASHRLRGRAYHHEQAGEKEEALALYIQAARREMERGAYETAQELLDHALTLAGEAPTPASVEIWLLLAQVADIRGQAERRQDAVAHALRLAGWLGDASWQVRAQGAAGLYATLTGQHTEAAIYLGQALKLARSLEDGHTILEVLLALAELNTRTGDFAAARACFEEARDLARQLNAAAQEAEALDGLGFVYPALGEPPEQAEQALRQALALRRAVGDPLGEARVSCNLTSFLQSRGAHDRALQVGAEALIRNEAVGYQRGTAAIQIAMGLAASALGDFASAVASLQNARQALDALGDVVGVTIATANLGLVAERANHLAEAARLYREALELAVNHGAAFFAALARHDLARVHVKLGAWQEALALLPTAETYFHKTGDLLYTQSCRTLTSRALLALGQEDQAREMAEGCWQAWAQGDFSGDLLPDWLWHLADLIAALGEEARARQILAAAHAVLEKAAAVIQDEAARQAFFQDVHVHRCIHQAFTDGFAGSPENDTAW